LIHLNAPTFVPLFALALALTWLYERTDNLLAPITAHALFNAANYMAVSYTHLDVYKRQVTSCIGASESTGAPSRSICKNVLDGVTRRKSLPQERDDASAQSNSSSAKKS